MGIVISLAAAAAVSPAAGASGQEPTGWKVGAAKTDITPSEPIRMSGFPERDQPSRGIRQELYARALALQDGRGKIAAIATLDLIMIDREMADAVAERCRSQYGLARDRLVITVSHTHTGPIAGRAIMPCYDLTAAQREVVQRYTESVIDRTVATIGASIHNLAPATLEFGQGLAGIAVNRRAVAFFRGLPGGPVDHDVPVLVARGAGGKPVAIVVGYACHASALRDYQISNDWPGYALQELDRAHPGATSFFIQGCAGDSNAFPRLGEELARGYGKVLAAAVEEVLRGNMTLLAGPLETSFARVDLPFHDVPTRDALQGRLGDGDVYNRRYVRSLLDILDRDGRLPASYPYPIQVWQFGHGLKFIALGGEPVVDYALRLKRQYGFDSTWVAGYSNDVMAYIPSLRVLREGGYEGGGAMVYYGRPGVWGAPVEEIIVQEVHDLVQPATAPVSLLQVK